MTKIRWRGVIDIYCEECPHSRGYNIDYVQTPYNPEKVILHISYFDEWYEIELDKTRDYDRRQVKSEAKYVSDLLYHRQKNYKLWTRPR